MKIAELQQLADFLRTPAVSSHFNLNSWIRIDRDYRPDPDNSKSQICWEELHDTFLGHLCPTNKPLECNTAACALGWAPTLFHKQGLYLEEGSGQVVYIQRDKEPVQEYYDFDAGAQFFEITEEQSRLLFDPEAYREYKSEDLTDYYYVDPTSAQVADRIEWLIANPTEDIDLYTPEHTTLCLEKA